MAITTQPLQSYKRGDVVLVLYPNSNLKTAKTRPALVIQADSLGTGLTQVVVVMITSNMSRDNHLSRVAVIRATEIGLNSGLLSDSIVMTDNVATIIDAAIYRVIGNMPMSAVDAALRHTLAL